MKLFTYPESLFVLFGLPPYGLFNGWWIFNYNFRFLKFV